MKEEKEQQIFITWTHLFYCYNLIMMYYRNISLFRNDTNLFSQFYAMDRDLILGMVGVQVFHILYKQNLKMVIVVVLTYFFVSITVLALNIAMCKPLSLLLYWP